MVAVAGLILHPYTLTGRWFSHTEPMPLLSDLLTEQATVDTVSPYHTIMPKAPPQPYYWEKKIQDARTLTDIFAVLLEMKEKKFVIPSETQMWEPEQVAESIYAAVCMLKQVFDGKGGHSTVGEKSLPHTVGINLITKSCGLRSTVDAILMKAQINYKTIPEWMIPPPSLAFVCMKEQDKAEFYEHYNLKPRPLTKISFDNVDTFADLFAVLYEMRIRGERVVSKSGTQHPVHVAQNIVEACQHINRDGNYDDQLRTIPTEVRKAVIRILSIDIRYRSDIPKELAALAMAQETVDERAQELPREEQYAGTILVGKDVQQAPSRSRKRPKPWDWKDTLICLVGLLGASVAGKMAHQNYRELHPVPDDDQKAPIQETPQETPLSTPDMLEDMEQDFLKQHTELRGTEPVQWHELTPAQRLKIKNALTVGETYYLPFVESLMKVSNTKMTKDGRITRDPYKPIADVEIVARDLWNYFNLHRIRAFTVDIDPKKQTETILGQMQGGSTPNDISDDVFALWLPLLNMNTSEVVKTMYHEDAHGYPGGDDHRGGVELIPRDEAAFAQKVLETTDYPYYLDCLMNVLDYLQEYYVYSFTESLKRALTPAAQKEVYQEFQVQLGSKDAAKIYAQEMAQLFFYRNSSLRPLGITQAELAHVIQENPRIFELMNEALKRRFKQEQEPRNEQPRKERAR